MLVELVLQSEGRPGRLFPIGFAHPKMDKLSEDPDVFKLMLEVTEPGVMQEPTEMLEFLRELPGTLALLLFIALLLLFWALISCGIFGAPITPVEIAD